MRVLLLTHFFPPEIGAAPSLYYELGRALARRGHEVHVLTGMPHYNLPSEPEAYRRRFLVQEQMDELVVWRIRSLVLPMRVPLLRGLDHFTASGAYFLRGLSLPRPDFILVHSPPLPLGITARLLALRFGAKILFNVQDLFPQNAVDLGIVRNRLAIKALDWLERWIYRHSAALIVQVEGARDHVLRRGAPTERIHLIRNWVDTSLIRPWEGPPRWRNEHGFADSFTVLYAGNIGYAQNLDVILEAASLLVKEEGVAFLIVGGGIAQAAVQREAERRRLRNIYFFPMQPYDVYAEIAATANVNLVTVRSKVRTPILPTKMLSGMAAGRPQIVLAPRPGEPERMVAEANCGAALDPDDAPGLAATILRLRENPDLLEEMGCRARAYAVKNLDVGVAADQYETLFTKLAGGQA